MRKQVTAPVSLIIALLCVYFCKSYAFSPSSLRSARNCRPGTCRSVSASDNSFSTESENNKSFVLAAEDVNPILRLDMGGKEKVVNAFGLWTLAVTLITGPIWMMTMSLMNMIYKMNDTWDPDRKMYDATGKVWSKTWLSLSNSYPTFSGHVELLKERDDGACLFVANHASWMDIPVLCTVLDTVFKFIAKGELKKVPCIGQQLEGGNHILIDREDRRSQLRTFKEGITWLKKGVPVMAFPEGMRSADGRLMDFKGGLFAMAVKTKVPIVPITISHTHAIMPSNALFPVQSGAGKLHIHVHAPISAEDRTDAELSLLVREAFVSSLPDDQLPLEKITIEENADQLAPSR